jgi:DNA-binding response OmpR family regulator
MRILIIADQSYIPAVLENFLSIKTNLVNVVENNLLAWQYLQDFDFDLVIMSSICHSDNAVILCHKLRKNQIKVPILIMVEMGSIEEQVLGLDAGADEYLIHPIELDSVNAKIRSLLRRKDLNHSPLIIEFGALCIDLYTKVATYEGRILALRPKEFSILELFARNPDRVFSRYTILEQVWDCHSDLPEDNTVKAHIRSLRMQLKLVGAGHPIETVYGVGYRLNSPRPCLKEDTYASVYA